MKTIHGRVISRLLVGATFAAVILAAVLNTNKADAVERPAIGHSVDPANPSDELITGPYRVDPNWPRPFAEVFPEEKGWTWGAVQGVFVQNPDRIFVVMRGLLPDVSNLKSTIVEVQNEHGMPVHLQVPGRGMYVRNASVGPYASPGEATDSYKGIEGKDYRWKHIITVWDSKGNLKESWTQWDSLFKPENPNVLAQGRVHKILISPYDPEKRVWAIDDGHQVIHIFSNDGKRLLQTIGTRDTTTERNAKMTGNTGRPSFTRKTGPANATFGRQTDIAWLPDGTFFVTDGYEETRVVKFDKNGKFLMAWGERGENGKEMRPNYFNTVHGIAIDNQRRIYVNDRGNRRIQVFDENGKFLSQWYLGDGPTATYHIVITADQHLWASDGHGNFKFYKYDLNGRLLYSWGTMMPEKGGLWGTHQFGVDQLGNLYTAEVWGGRPQKFVPRKGADPSLLVGQPVRGAWTE
jgi:6-bladed beta-propeller protein